jgi:hypothetical protein
MWDPTPPLLASKEGSKRARVVIVFDRSFPLEGVMAGEIHYAVCLRCGMIHRNAMETLTKHRVVRGALGNLVIRAFHRVGCSVCGHAEVEVRWGVPPSLTSHASFAGSRAASLASLAARRALQ